MREPRPLRVLHLITGTAVGGAETMLFKLLSAMDRSRFHNTVCSMMEPGPVADWIRNLGIEVLTLGIRQGHLDLRAIPRLYRAIRSSQPELIQTWMYHANLLGGCVGKLAGIPVVWGIHHTELDPTNTGRMTRLVDSVCARLSGWLPTQIVCCAESGRTLHVRRGYEASMMTVIPNGFDLELYRPRSDARTFERARFGIPPNCPILAHVARYDPQKDHRTFMQAAQRCAGHFPEALFVLCGEGLTAANPELMKIIKDAGIENNVFLLGRLSPSEVALLMAEATLLTSSSSYGEAFPMVVGEAMASGTVCVVTDVGDSAYMVGDAGFVVPPCSPEKLAEAWEQVLRMDREKRQELGRRARQRIESLFSLAAITARYQNLYAELPAGDAPSRQWRNAGS